MPWEIVHLGRGRYHYNTTHLDHRPQIITAMKGGTSGAWPGRSALLHPQRVRRRFEMWDYFLLFVAVGFIAQMVDGAIGMAYGVTSTSVLLSVGVAPATASAAVHAAEVFT